MDFPNDLKASLALANNSSTINDQTFKNLLDVSSSALVCENHVPSKFLDFHKFSNLLIST